jgi:Domain of unknown function (DUF4873)
VILDRYEGPAFVVTEARTIHGVVQLTSWQGEGICYWGGLLHLTSTRDRALAIASEHTFLTIGGPETYVTIGEGDQEDGPLAVTGHGEPPFGAPDRTGKERWA